MPYKKQYKKKKRKYARKKRSVPLPLGGMGTSHLVKLRYSQTFVLDPGAGLAAIQAFRANGLQDPDLTGIGHQPSNFDRWSLFFDRYTVLGARCSVVPVYINNTNVIPGLLCLALSENGTVISTSHGLGGISNIIEQPRLKVSMKNLGTVNTDGYGSLTKNFSAKKFFGIKNIKGVQPYTSDVTTNPAEQAFFEVGYVSSDDANNPGPMTFRATIDYIALLTEPKMTDAS